MKKRCRNIYRIARKSAGLTQEEAAELLNVSPRTLSDYESGKSVPPDDVVCRMIEVYKADWLAYKHLKQTEIGNRYLPNIDSTDLAKSVLRLQKEVRDFQVISNEIIDIACQGMIKEHDKRIYFCSNCLVEFNWKGTLYPPLYEEKRVKKETSQIVI